MTKYKNNDSNNDNNNNNNNNSNSGKNHGQIALILKWFPEVKTSKILLKLTVGIAQLQFHMAKVFCESISLKHNHVYIDIVIVIYIIDPQLSDTCRTNVGVDPWCSTMVGYGPSMAFVDGFGVDLNGE